MGGEKTKKNTWAREMLKGFANYETFKPWNEERYFGIILFIKLYISTKQQGESHLEPEKEKAEP